MFNCAQFVCEPKEVKNDMKHGYINVKAEYVSTLLCLETLQVWKTERD